MSITGKTKPPNILKFKLKSPEGSRHLPGALFLPLYETPGLDLALDTCCCFFSATYAVGSNLGFLVPGRIEITGYNKYIHNNVNVLYNTIIRILIIYILYGILYD